MKTFFSITITTIVVVLLCISFIPQTLAVDSATVVKLQNPIGGTAEKPEGTTDVRAIYGQAIKAALGILGSLTLLAFIFGGFTWLTSGGSPDKVKKGMNTLLYAAVGLFVIFATYGILDVFIKGITK